MRPSNNLETRLLQTHMEEFIYYVWKFRLTIRTTHPWQIKVRYDLSNILAVTEILCSFRLVLKEFLVKFLTNNFALSDAEDNNFRPLNRRYSRFTFVENTISNLPESQVSVEWWTLWFISICKFEGFKNTFAMITSLSELYFRLNHSVLQGISPTLKYWPYLFLPRPLPQKNSKSIRPPPLYEQPPSKCWRTWLPPFEMYPRPK